MLDFNESSTPQLPIYTSSVSLPSYTHELASGERRLQHTPRSNVHRPTSVFIKKSRKAAVVLNNQEEGARIPTFGRASVISGFISSIYRSFCQSFLSVTLCNNSNAMPEAWYLAYEETVTSVP